MAKLPDTQLIVLSNAAQQGGKVLAKGAAAAVLKALLKRKLLDEVEAGADDQVWREAEGQHLALVLAPAGWAAIGAEPPGEDIPQETESDRRQTPPKAGTALAKLVSLLGRKNGVSIAEAIKATGWQAHSIRGAISGALKKKHGLAIASEATEGRGRVYRIVR